MFGKGKITSSRFRNVRLQVEMLESRVVPYATTGNVWPHPELITISFEPDGTNLGGVTSNLFSTFNARFGSPKAWQTQIEKAAQQWAAATNINFTVIADSGAASGSGSYQQGDPSMGDIRIGGYNFGNNNTLAAADFSPSANNYSVGGDITFNTNPGVGWNIGSTYDVYSVAMHEIGHALGMDHSNSASAVMFAGYTGTQTGLTSDDVSGIRSIYGAGSPRSATYAPNQSASAYDVTSLIDSGTNSALVAGLNMTTAAGAEWFKFTTPSAESGSLNVSVQSKGLSQFSPKFYVYNSSLTQIGAAGTSGSYGATISTTLSGIAPGSTYYVKVVGAEATSGSMSAFDTGAYAMTLNMGTGSAPTVPLPNTTTANGTPLHSGGGLGEETLLGLLLSPVNFLFGDLTGGIFSGLGDLMMVHEGHDEAPVDLASIQKLFGLSGNDHGENWTPPLTQTGEGATESPLNRKLKPTEPHPDSILTGFNGHDVFEAHVDANRTEGSGASDSQGA